MRDALVVRRWTRAARWLLVAAAAYAGALAINAAISFWLDSTPDLTLAKTHRASGARVVRSNAPARGHSIIFERNLFGGEPIVVSAGTEPLALGDSSLDLRLRGTAEVDGVGYAVLEDAAGDRQDVFAVGESIFEGPTLVSVGDGTAVIQIGARKQTLEIADVTAPGGQARDGDTRGAAGTDGIRKTGANNYLVDRREIEHSIENLNQIATQMRAVPFLKDGDAIGFRVFNIRAGSVFERMGLKNGDVIQKVNGVELNSPTKALALLEDVQTTSEIRVDLLRENAPSTLVYSVR